jgi:hypothetical protein
MFVEVFTTDKKAELLEKLMKSNDTLSTSPTKTLGLSISLFKIKQQLLLGDMFKSSANGGSHTVIAYEYILIIILLEFSIVLSCLKYKTCLTA